MLLWRKVWKKRRLSKPPTLAPVLMTSTLQKDNDNNNDTGTENKTKLVAQ